MKRPALVIGDIIALFVVTLIGFASHGELSASFFARMAASLLPLYIGWFLLAPAIGLFDERRVLAPGELWRPAFAMLFAGPLAALLRGIALNSPVIPSFAIVLSLTSAVALTAWRGLWLLLGRRLSAR